jgi:uncharacterized protein (DUF433 family)
MLLGPFTSEQRAATKWGMNGLSESLRQELQPDVRVIVVEPGAVATELVNHITHGETKEAIEQFYDATSITAEDIAEIIAFAVSRPRVEPGVSGDRRHGGRSVAGEDLELDALLAEVRDRRLRLIAPPLGEDDQAKGLQHARERRIDAAGERALGAGERDDAPARALPVVRGGEQRPRGDELRRPQHERAVAQLDRAPASA